MEDKELKETIKDTQGVDEATTKLSGFGKVVRETKEQIAGLIPSLTTFFGVFRGAQIAQGITQVAKFEQSFKNLSYQLGQGNSKTQTFLKNIYEVKAVTGDTADNLKEISTELIRNRVVGEEALKKLTTAVSFFSEATGTSVTQASQLAGKLSRLGQLGPDSIEDILTSMMKVQRAFGMTSEEMENLANGITETTALLYNMGKNAAFIEDFQKGTVKLAAAFASVGVEAKNATDIVDRLLDLDRIEDNALLYSKLGISIQDAIMGNIDPGALQDRLKLLGKEIASMSRPAGYALSRQMGLKYGEVIKYQNMKPEAAEQSDKTLQQAAEEQRTVFTRIDKFFSSSLGKLATMFLQSPMSFGNIFAAGLVFGITNAIAKSVKKYRAIGQQVGDAVAESIAQGIRKSGIIKGLRGNQGVTPDSGSGSVNAASNGGSTIAAYQQGLNSIETTARERKQEIGSIYNRLSETRARLTYLRNNGQENTASFDSVSKMEKSLQKEFVNAYKKYRTFITDSTKTMDKLKNNLTDTDKLVMKTDAINNFKGFLGNVRQLNEQSNGLKNRIDALQKQLDKTKDPMKRESIQATINKLNEEKGGIDSQKAEVSGRLRSSLRNIRGLGIRDRASTLSNWTPEAGAFPIAGEQTKTLGQRFVGAVREKGSEALSAGGKAIGGYFKNLGSGLLGGFKKLLFPLTPMMIGITIISKLMSHFQPLLEMMMPMLDSIFDIIAKMIAPLVKWGFTIIYTIIGSVQNGLAKAWNAIMPKGKEIPLIDVKKGLAEIKSWDVGKKMDKQAEDKEQEDALTIEAAENGVKALNLSDPKILEKFNKYFGGQKGFDRLYTQLDELIKLTNKDVTQTIKGNEDANKREQERREQENLRNANNKTLGSLPHSGGFWSGGV